jgi:nitrogenase subunit NifH
MQTKRERDEDRKMISMLRNKNEQILHEIKKKEQETVRVKEQMKKNIGEKTPTKNSFEVFQNIGNRSPSKEKQAVDDKYIFLLERN